MVFQTPPVADATYMIAGSEGSTLMSCTRPPVAAGPIERNFSESNGDCAIAVVDAATSRSDARRTGGSSGPDCGSRNYFPDGAPAKRRVGRTDPTRPRVSG